jgi:glycosyltransferase involved in cell wall biosynthesis
MIGSERDIDPDHQRVKPFFSVLIPSYNRPCYLRKCIDSILKNDFKDLEIIISDDNSPKVEEIRAVANLYLDHQNITFVKQPKNLGWAENRNYLVANAIGKYVLLLGDDDEFYPDTLGRLRRYIERYPQYDLYGLGYSVIDENDVIRYSHSSPRAFEISLRNPEIAKELFFSDIIHFWTFNPFTICYDYKIGEEIKYLKDAFIGDDLLFLFDCINNGKKIFVIPELLFLWRKIQDKSKDGQLNLSGLGINCLKARGNILYLLQQRKDLAPYISELVLSKAYTKRFFFCGTRHDKSISRVILDELKNRETHLANLIDDYQTQNFLFRRFRMKAVRFFDYVCIFGLTGIFRVFLFLYQHIHYRIRKKFKR